MAGSAWLSASVEIAERSEIVRHTLQNGYGRDNSSGSAADADIARNMISKPRTTTSPNPPKFNPIWSYLTEASEVDTSSLASGRRGEGKKSAFGATKFPGMVKIWIGQCESHAMRGRQSPPMKRKLDGISKIMPRDSQQARLWKRGSSRSLTFLWLLRWFRRRREICYRGPVNMSLEMEIWWRIYYRESGWHVS